MKRQLTTPNRCPSAMPLGALLACCLGLNLPATLAGLGTWIRMADMPEVVGGAAGCALDGALYVAGGEPSYKNPGRTLLVYQPKTDSWTRKTDMPTARTYPMAGAVGGRLYVVGGLNTPTSAAVAAVEAYDPTTDTWSTKTPMPTARGGAAVATLNGLIYVMGGYGTGMVPMDTVEHYDPATDQWTTKASLPEASPTPVAQVVNGTIYLFSNKDHTFAYDPATDSWRTRAPITPPAFDCHASACGAVDGAVYLFGGLSLTSALPHALALAYDPVQDAFSFRRMLPEPRMMAAHATLHGRVYLAGGTSGNPAHGAPYVETLWVFDPADTPGSWARKADLPEAIGGAAGCELDGIFYVAGGEPSYQQPGRTFFAYDPKTDSWSRKAEMPTARLAPVAAASNGLVYVIGGMDPVTWIPTAVVEAYDPQADTWSTKTPMLTARGSAAVATLDGLIYVMGGAIGLHHSVVTVECYEPKTDQWRSKKDLPEASAGAITQVAHGRIHLVNAQGHVFACDPKTDSWISMPPITDPDFYCYVSAAGVVGDVIYLFGGLRTVSPIAAHKLTLACGPDQAAPNAFAAKRMLPEPRMMSAYATMDGKIYVAGGNGGNPTRGDPYVKSLYVFDPQGGRAIRIWSLAREANDTVRLVWLGEEGRRYGVKSTDDLVKGPWVDFPLSNGPTIQATNDVMEAIGTVAATDAQRFFRVYEAD